MSEIKKQDFVEIEFVGRLEDETVFDTNKLEILKEKNWPKEAKLRIICLGENWIHPEIDQFLIGKEINQEYELRLEPEKAFGKKDMKKIKLVPYEEFLKHQVKPEVGLITEIDGELATIIRISGGRVLVNFNHPLAGRTVTYQIKILRKVEEEKEKVESILWRLGTPPAFEIKENKILIKDSLPEEIKNEIGEEIKKLTPFKEIEWLKKS